ncbi:hypothetical protein [Leptothermofonsia sp. ETS-13]|uniref:hypothetical protein n=1 Tax=Leptothermofonsia sp. ETS-13 TaxID=3035696 RepID=UPI003BA1ACE2
MQIELGLKTRAEVRQIRNTVDAEHLAAKAFKPVSEPARGFGSLQSKSAKKSKKK